MLAPLEVFAAREAMEGAGVRIRRAIGTTELPNLDPFLMLDYFDSDRADDYLAGFPDHPHRGFITVTYMLSGRMEHRDSMGHQGVIGPGDVQWMKAASGVIHSEMPRQIEGRMAGFQLWLNLPAAQKMSAPEYQEFAHEAFPVWHGKGVDIKVLAGAFDDVRGPISDPNTDVHYLDAALESNADVTLEVPAGHVGFAFVYAGSPTLNGSALDAPVLARLGAGELKATTGDTDAGFILVHGRPIKEPIVQRGPFVMNTGEEIHKAIMDYHAGRLVQPVAAGQARS